MRGDKMSDEKNTSWVKQLLLYWDDVITFGELYNFCPIQTGAMVDRFRTKNQMLNRKRNCSNYNR